MLKALMRSWDQLAEKDAFWAVLTEEQFAEGRWNPERFFATGESDVEAAFRDLAGRGLCPKPGRALDFGCGLGRLSRSLARRFGQVDAVDVSRVMIDKAKEINAGVSNLRFHHNAQPQLALFPSKQYDFIFSLICLQHMPEKLAAGYVSEFCRLLAPGGVAYLQVCSFLDVSSSKALAKLDRDERVLNRLYRRLLRLLDRRRAKMDCHYLRLSVLFSVLERERMQVQGLFPDTSIQSPYASHIVIFRKVAEIV